MLYLLLGLIILSILCYTFSKVFKKISEVFKVAEEIFTDLSKQSPQDEELLSTVKEIRDAVVEDPHERVDEIEAELDELRLRRNRNREAVDRLIRDVEEER